MSADLPSKPALVANDETRLPSLSEVLTGATILSVKGDEDDWEIELDNRFRVIFIGNTITVHPAEAN